MRKVSTLVESYLQRRTTTVLPDGSTPVRIVRSNTDTPLRPSNRWEPMGRRSIRKRFEFRDFDLRDRFILDIMEYEREHGHRARIVVDELSIEIDVGTKDIESVTELDKEYAREADLLYRNICFG